VLAQEIQRSRRFSQELTFLSDLTLISQIGRGGYGTVYAGIWRNQPAAIKVQARASAGCRARSGRSRVFSRVGHGMWTNPSAVRAAVPLKCR
jgi:serine/threonine protein kinase